MVQNRHLFVLGLLSFACFAALLISQEKTGMQPNILSPREKAEGWILLFDGTTFEGWRGLGRDRVPEGQWLIEDGAIKKVSTQDGPLQKDGQPLAGGDLMTVEAFEDFELSFEWKISPGGNSGLKYNVS
jgi:hypothetical protein